MTAFLRLLPAENFGTVAALMYTFSLGLRGLTPSRAARWVARDALGELRSDAVQARLRKS